MAPVSSRRVVRVAQASNECCSRAAHRGQQIRVQNCTWRHGKKVVVLFCIVGLLAFPGVASADPKPSFPTDCSADLDVGTCERLDYIATQVAQYDADQQALGWAIGALLAVAIAPVIYRTFGRSL